MKKMRYGMIGAGQMGRGHLDCVEEIAEIAIVAVADPHKGNLEAFKDKNSDGHTQYFPDHRDLLRMEEVDAVVISTPDDTHVGIVIDALDAGKHVLSEKPAATSHEDLRRLEQRVNRSDKVYQVGLECRYLPVFQRMKAIVEEGTIGTPRMLWCKEFRGPFLEKVDNWIMFNERTGSVFVEKTCHYFDLMTWFSGSCPKKVLASAGLDVVREIYGVTPDVFDNGWVIIEYESGARANLGLCMFAHDGPDIEMGVIGDRGRMEGFFSGQRIDLWEYEGKKTVSIDTRVDSDKVMLSHGGGVYYEHLAFLDNIRRGGRPLTDITAAKWSTVVGLAAEESARGGGRAVSLS